MKSLRKIIFSYNFAGQENPHFLWGLKLVTLFCLHNFVKADATKFNREKGILVKCLFSVSHQPRYIFSLAEWTLNSPRGLLYFKIVSVWLQ